MWKANKYITTILLWFFGVLSVLVCAYVFIKCGKLNKIDHLEELIAVLNPLFYWVVVLIAVTAVLAVFLPMPQVIDNPKSALGIVVGVLSFCAVVGLAYLLSSGDPLPFTPGHREVSPEEIKFADVNIIAIGIMLSATILVTIGTSIWNVIKMR